MSKLVEDMKKFRAMLDQAPQTLNEAWDAKMHTAKKDVGKWDGYTVAELKAKKAKLMKKETRSAAEQKLVKQIDFAIRAKQKNKWGKIKESDESVVSNNAVAEADMSAVQSITPLYQKIQGLVPSFKEPISSYLLQAQKALGAALEVAHSEQVKEDNNTDLE
jgi:hypothetical protein